MAEELQPVLEILTRPDSTPEARAAAMRVLSEAEDPNAPLLPEGTGLGAGIGALAGAALGYKARPFKRLFGGVTPDVKLRHLLQSVGREKDNWMKYAAMPKTKDATTEQLLDAFKAKGERLRDAGLSVVPGAAVGAGVVAATADEDPRLFERGQMDEQTYNAVLEVLTDPNMDAESKQTALEALENQGEHLDTGLSTFGKVAIGGALGSLVAGQLGRRLGRHIGSKKKAAKEGLTPAEKGENWGELIGDLAGGTAGGFAGAAETFNQPENHEFNRYLDRAAAGDQEAAQKLRQVYARTLEQSPVGEFQGGLAGLAIGTVAGGLPAFLRNETLRKAFMEKSGGWRLLDLGNKRLKNLMSEVPGDAYDALADSAAAHDTAGQALINTVKGARDANRRFVFNKHGTEGAFPHFDKVVEHNGREMRKTLANAGLTSGIVGTVGAGVGTALGADYSDPFEGAANVETV